MNELLVDDLFKQHCSAAAKTNDIISTNEERQRGIDLLKCLVLKRSALSDLERGLLVSAQMDLAVDKISNERASRRRNTNDLQIAQLRISFAPHKRLPSKILATIFVAAVEGDDLISFPILLSQIPWVLGRVCNRWREISRAEPNLWNGVRMKIVGKRLPEAVSFLHNTLPASGPLTMMLEIARDCETSTVETLILPYSRRLEKFHLSGPDAMWQGLDIPAQSFSAVEDWAMAVHPLYRTSEVLKKLVFFRYTNNLRSFNAGGPIIKPEGQLINYNLPFHQLAHLDLSHVSEGYRLTDMLGLLRESSSLQSFSSPLADPSAMPHTGSTSSSELILPNLKTMDINNAVAMNLPLQWNNLTDLTIYVSFRAHGVLDRVLDILDSLQLNSLSFGHHPGRFVVASPLRIITITNLRKLSIQASGSRILGHLRLPQLVEIDVDGGRQNQHSFISNLSDLVTRSGCALEILSYDSPSNGRKRFHDDEFWASNVSATPARNLPAPPPPPPGVDPTNWPGCAIRYSNPAPKPIPRIVSDEILWAFLNACSSLKQVYAPGINPVGQDLLQKIADGILLPRLQVLKLNVQSSADFVDALVKHTKRCGKLRIAHGYIYNREGTETYSDTEALARDRLVEMNWSFASDFRLVRVSQ